MAEFYEMKIAGLDRKLKKCAVSDELDIAAFIILGDVEITVESAKALLKKVPDFDIILTAECKGIPLAYEMARQSGKPYVVARKTVKLYMQDVISVAVKSITTAQTQVLHLDGETAAFMKGKRVLIVDDVISTGESLNALEALAKKAEANIIGEACVLAEGSASKREDLIYLEPLPLFFKD